MKVRINLIFIFGVLIFGIGLTLFLLLFIKGESLLPKEVVYIPENEEILEYTEVTKANFKELFKEVEILQAAVNKGMITRSERDTIYGKYIVRPLHKDEWLTKYHVGKPFEAAKKGEKAYPIPNSWWEVLDWTGRMGDIGDIWLSPTEKLTSVALQSENTTTTTFRLNNQNEQTTNQNIKVDKKETYDERLLKEPVLVDKRIRYISDDANKAVRNAAEAHGRSDGTSNPSNAKIWLTEKEFGDLKMMVHKGYKLILVTEQGGFKE